MIGQSAPAVETVPPTQDMFHAAANMEHRGDYGTLIVDRMGHIVSCGAPAEKIFRTRAAALTGRWVGDFIVGLFLGGSSPSYSARYLIYLCADGEWRKFPAIDAEGVHFTVDLKMSRVVTDGEEMFLISVHRAEGTATR